MQQQQKIPSYLYRRTHMRRSKFGLGISHHLTAQLLGSENLLLYPFRAFISCAGSHQIAHKWGQRGKTLYYWIQMLKTYTEIREHLKLRNMLFLGIGMA